MAKLYSSLDTAIKLADTEERLDNCRAESKKKDIKIAELDNTVFCLNLKLETLSKQMGE